MSECVHQTTFSRRRNIRQDKWKRRLEQLAQMRSAKARKRLERGSLEETPKMQRWYPFEFGVRDKRSGETAWHDLVSVRYATKALSLIQKYIA